MNIRPMYDHVLLRRIPEDETTPGGLVIPESAKEQSSFCEVLAAGPGRILKDGSLLPCHMHPGEKVIIGKWVGDKYVNKHLTQKYGDGSEFLIIREEAIFCVVDD